MKSKPVNSIKEFLRNFATALFKIVMEMRNRAAAVCLSSVVLLWSCSSVSYYCRAISGQYKILSDRRPISKVLADPATSEELKQRLLFVLAVREFAKEALRDLLALQAKLVTIENIQKTVAEYFKVKLMDLLSKRRNRSFARPRQIAMTLAKELTSNSLAEIGEAFGGRDHSTVLHACQRVKELLKENPDLAKDYRNLLRILST